MMFPSSMFPWITGRNYFSWGKGSMDLMLNWTDSDYAFIVKRKLQEILPYPYTIKGWMDLNRRIFTALQTEKRVMFILLVLAIVVAGSNIIISTLIMDGYGKDQGYRHIEDDRFFQF